MIALLIFVVSYIGIALGRFPGTGLDRMGVALLGAIMMVVTGVISVPEAFDSIDFPTILLLYALMVLSAQFRLGGFYTQVALSIAGMIRGHPTRFLLCLMLLSALMSAILANDIVCLAFTPVVAHALLKAGRNPLPHLLGLTMASNIGSAATLIGNPQNMLLGQVGQLDFGHYLLAALPPTLVALAACYGLIRWMCRTALKAEEPPRVVGPEVWPTYDRWQSFKGLVLTLVLVGLFFTPIPRELSAMAIAGILLCSRRLRSRDMLGLVDWQLITLFCALFILNAGLESGGWPAQLLAQAESDGIDVHQPYTLAGLALVLSNLVSNVPAVMLLINTLPADSIGLWYILGLASTYAGNLFLFGSIANLITAEQAARQGIAFTFGAYLRVGLPVTAASMIILALWIPFMPGG